MKGQRVRLDGEMVMGLIAKAPRRFEMTSRDPAQHVEISLDTMTFGTMQGAPNIRDLQGVRRASTIEDLRNMNRLTQMFLASILPADLPASRRTSRSPGATFTSFIPALSKRTCRSSG